MVAPPGNEILELPAAKIEQFGLGAGARVENGHGIGDKVHVAKGRDVDSVLDRAVDSMAAWDDISRH